LIVRGARVLVVALAWAGLAVIASAEQIGWRKPDELVALPLPASDVSRNAARDTTMSRFEYNDGRVLRRILVTDTPARGRLATDPVGILVADVVGRTAAATCVSHTLSPAREFSVGGRPAAEVTLICRGIISPPETIPNQIDVRRTVLIQGQTRVFMFQADEYARDSESFDHAVSAARWDDAIASLSWCADSGAECSPVAPAN
jgi:hypothetical protein